MLHLLLTLTSSHVLQPAIRHPTAAAAVPRHAAVHARLVTFEATRTVTSQPFDATDGALQSWFGKPESIDALCSMADESRQLDDGRVEVTTLIPFPGMCVYGIPIRAHSFTSQ